MMKLEILEELPVSDDQTIVKRKRTKRLRPSSSASSSGGAAAAGNSLVYSSPASSSGISTSTEEDEDMANCLILLARGPAENKLSSRKFTEMATTTAGKVGIYVYECKTCNRAFPSFQALGGHRASHKRPKLAADIDQKRSPPPPADDQEEDEKRFVTPPNSTLLPPNKIICHINEQNKPKIHECSICGSEFASGQALGGHMRRHRAAAAAPPIAGTRIVATIDNDTPSNDVSEKPRSVLALDLDLNLPAPPEDDKFSQFSAKQQPSIVFSAAALVDCHY
ncbi:zinc finger protein zat5 [Phtheirospermum japonicum]|uniref:Zinc finger protein zat5 n=1 Tax=Phtheirospermum japonicum TaxID=374723 RepID=A0A830D3N2_9LAMI|nr:zinc finger protein zat5 [Phtheirospermum japonicum]